MTKRDIARLRRVSSDPLKCTFIEMAYTVMKLPPTIDPSLEQNIRQSLHALGSAIDDVRPAEHEASPVENYVGMGLSRERLYGKKRLVPQKMAVKIPTLGQSSGDPVALKKQAD